MTNFKPPSRLRNLFSTLGNWLLPISTLAIFTGAGWAMAIYFSDSKVEVYKSLASWDAPSTIREMRSLSQSISEHASSIASTMKTERELETMKRQVPNLQKAIDELEANNVDLRRQLAAYTGDTFSVSPGESRALLPGILFVGVHFLTNTQCHISIGESNAESLSVGQHMTIRDGEQTRQLALTRITSKGCEFSFK